MNKEWLAGVYEAFEIAVAEGSYVDCKDLIEHLKAEGFEVEAKQLEQELVEETLGTFIHETDARTWK